MQKLYNIYIIYFRLNRCKSYETRAEAAREKLRVTVLGAEGVGKTSIVRRFIKEKIIQEYRHTNTDQNFLKCDRVTVEVLDTGNLLLPRLRKMAMQTADAFVLVYAVDDIQSFNYICQLLNEIVAVKGHDFPMVVAGNKVDITCNNRQINPVVADCVVTMDHECPHVEVSAKEAFELTTVFEMLFQHPRLFSKVAELRIQSLAMTNSPNENVVMHSQITEGRVKRSRSIPWTWLTNLFK